MASFLRRTRWTYVDESFFFFKLLCMGCLSFWCVWLQITGWKSFQEVEGINEIFWMKWMNQNEKVNSIAQDWYTFLKMLTNFCWDVWKMSHVRNKMRYVSNNMFSELDDYCYIWLSLIHANVLWLCVELNLYKLFFSFWMNNFEQFLVGLIFSCTKKFTLCGNYKSILKFCKTVCTSSVIMLLN